MICIQKIYCFHGINRQNIEKSWYVTPVTEEEDERRKVENRAVFCWTRNRKSINIKKKRVRLSIILHRASTWSPYCQSPNTQPHQAQVTWGETRLNILLFLLQSSFINFNCPHDKYVTSSSCPVYRKPALAIFHASTLALAGHACKHWKLGHITTFTFG